MQSIQGPQRPPFYITIIPTCIISNIQRLIRCIRQIFASIFCNPHPPAPAKPLSQKIATIPFTEPKTKEKLQEAKEREKLALYTAYRKAGRSTLPQSSLRSKEIISKGALLRDILRQAKIEGHAISQKDICTVRENIQLLFNLDKKTETVSIGSWSLDGKAIFAYAKRAQEINANAQLSKEYTALCTITKKLQTLLQEESPSNLSKTNMKVLKKLREALATPIYTYLCHDETIPEINLLHRLVMASFVNIHPLVHFESLGSHISEHGQINIDNISSQKEFIQTLRAFRDKGQEQKLMASDRTVEYVLSSTNQIIGAAQSEGWLSGPYDPRGKLENIGGSFFQEQLRVGDNQRVSLTAIYTCSPTIGDKVSPETKAFLQAMENRFFMEPKELEKEPEYAQHIHWTYANLQNITGKHEGPRSCAIMALNHQYPFSFTGITVTQDSDLFTDGIKEHSQAKREEKQRTKPPLSEKFARDMHRELVSKNCGYYFPLHSDADRAQWETTAKEIVNKAYKMTHPLAKNVPEGKDPQLWNFTVKRAFCELVNLGVIRYWQMKTLPKGGSALVSNCCKECIDRGGKTMSEFLWALGDNSSKTLKHVIYSAHSRALLARKRLILPHRLEPFLALVEVVEQQKVKIFLTKEITHLADTAITSDDIMPCLPT